MTSPEIQASATPAARLAQAVVKVPEITVLFWVLKLITTGTGEATSDFLGSVSVPLAGLLGVSGFLIALAVQLRRPGYSTWRYWGLVMMVAVFGTMVADGVHDGANLPYTVTTTVGALFVGAVFALWYRSEGTLSIHEINTRRREWFYWCAVFGTFALGTAAGDWTATTLGLGFLGSVALFAVAISVPLIAWSAFGLNPIVAFWIAYVLTRPLGASVADWLSKPSGLHLGDGPVALAGWLTAAAVVGYLAHTGRDRRIQHIELHLPRHHAAEQAADA
jgi:uncharacterized membrane-anchored protein